MSRIGKKAIEIPAGVEVQIEGQKITVRGPKGELSREFRDEIKFEKRDNQILVSNRNNSLETKALWGLLRTLIFNMVQGVNQKFEKKLEIEGIGYKAVVEGEQVVLNVGFTNPIKLPLPKDVTASIEKNVITVAGIDKAEVGQFAARIRAARPEEPYKGKGIRYQGEFVRKKLGKKAAAATGPGGGPSGAAGPAKGAKKAAY